MTQEDKQLLLKDLCTRVPYHPKGHVVNAHTGAQCDEWLTCATFPMFTIITNNCRLYLRPMSSMTEEEYDQLYIDSRVKEDSVDVLDALANDLDAIDWLNAHHFDYRGLIEKGLAIEAPKNMYKINNGNERIYIERKDSEWHPMNVEMPPHSTDVELLKPDGTIIKGEIVVEMSGYYIYLSPGWGDLNDYTHWRFIADKHYPDYE